MMGREKLIVGCLILGIFALPAAVLVALASPLVIAAIDSATSANLQFQTLASRKNQLQARQRAMPVADDKQLEIAVAHGATAEAAGQDAQVALRAALGQAGGTATGLQMTIEQGEKDFQQITIALQATLNEAALLTFLRIVEAHSPRLVLRSMDIQKVYGASGETLSLQAQFLGIYSAT